MPPPAILARIGVLIGVLSPIIATLMPNFRWWSAALFVEVLFVIGGIWIVNEAIDTETAKNVDNLDLLLGYAINVWMIIIGAGLFGLSFVVRAVFLTRKSERASH